MTHMLVRHKVADFDQWKPVYDAHRTAREDAGLKVLHLWCNEDDPNEVLYCLRLRTSLRQRSSPIRLNWRKVCRP